MGVAENEAPACLIDASIYIFRYYFALPDNWFSDDGYPTAAVYGYTTFLIDLLQNQKPARIAAAFDESLDSCFRNEIYPDYKSSRAQPDEALAFQLAACREVTELLGIASFASDTYEADDLIGSLMPILERELEAENTPIAVLTRDKDLGQLLKREQDFLWDKANEKRFYRQDIFDKFGVYPEQLVDYLALVGDSVDDIPGVPGIGAKTAQDLLTHGQDIMGIFERLDELPTLKIRRAKGLPDKLIEATEQIAMSRALAEIVCDIPLGVTARDLSLKSQASEPLVDFCNAMGFPRLINKINQLPHIKTEP